MKKLNLFFVIAFAIIAIASFSVAVITGDRMDFIIGVCSVTISILLYSEHENI
jgi:hypothetical protein